MIKVSKLLLGTGNQKKIEFYKRFLGDLNLEFATPKDLGIPEPEETGKTLDENAKMKAEYYCKTANLPVLADDGGFEIPALNNFPGVHSNRFLGTERLTDEQIINGIIEKMHGLEGNDRQARYKVALALALPSGEMYTASGQIDGTVPVKPFTRRMPHFPYRSLLYVTELNKEFMDITDEDEEKIGYRKAAVEQLKKYLK